MINEINYCLMTPAEWRAFKKTSDWTFYVDHARYYDKFNDGSKLWWVQFKFPLMAFTFFEMSKAIGVEIYKQRTKL